MQLLRQRGNEMCKGSLPCPAMETMNMNGFWSRIMEEENAIGRPAANSLSLDTLSPAPYPLLRALIPSFQGHCGTWSLHGVLTV